MRAVGKIASMVSALLVVGAAGAALQPAQAATPPPTWWTPGPNTTWQWQITGKVDTSVSPATMFDIDMQDAVPTATTIPVPGFGSGSVTWPKGQNAGVIGTLHSMHKIVICYTDGGAWEDYRSDAKLFPPSVLGSSTGWSGERWLDIRPRPGISSHQSSGPG